MWILQTGGLSHILHYKNKMVVCCKTSQPCSLCTVELSKNLGYRYSSDSGLSQIRTQYKILSTKDMAYGLSTIIPTTHFEPPKEENLSTKSKSVELVLSPKCQRFHCVYIQGNLV